MSNALKKLTESLRQDVLSPRHHSRFAEACQRRDDLGQYATTADVLRALSSERKDRYAERERLTRALLDEQRKHPSTLWSTMLIVAYYPMLSRLRFRLVSDRIGSDDLDQLVLMAFIRTIALIPFDKKPDRIAMHLRQYTGKQLFRLMFWESRIDSLANDEETELIDIAVNELVERDDLHEWQMMLGDLRRRVGDDIGDREIDTIAATVIGQEELWSFVTRVVTDDPTEQTRVYQRLKRQRTRALDCMRRLVPRNDELFERSA